MESSVFTNFFTQFFLFLEKIKFEKFKLSILSYFLLIIISFFVKSHYTKDLNSEFRKLEIN